MLRSRCFKLIESISIFLILFLITWSLGGTTRTFSSKGLGLGSNYFFPSPTGTQSFVPNAHQANTPTETPTASPIQKTFWAPEPSGTITNPSSTRQFQAPVTSKPTSALPIPNPPGKFSTDEVLLRFDTTTPENGIKHCLQSASAAIKSKIEEINVLDVNIPTGKVVEAIASLSSCHGILYAEPNYEVSVADTIPNDPGWGNQYGLMAIHAPQGWHLNTGSSAVTIAIVDTGVDLDHVDLTGKIVPGFDFVNNNDLPQDDDAQSHGTHVAGIVAAETNNGIGVAGVSWGAQIMPVKVLNSVGFGTYENVAAGIVWAADHGAQVINLSLGGSMPSSVLEDAVDYAYGKDVTLVAAAGNSGSNSVLYPARYPHVIAVAATDSTNNHASFSNFGPEIDVAAPGVNIYSTTLGDTYGYLSGTSMAAPFVSGLAAILRGIPGNDTPYQITKEIEISALDLGTPGRDDYYGYGLIQMDAALQVHVPAPTPATSRQVAAAVLPATGFSPERKTILPVQPAGKDYTVYSTDVRADLGDLWLEIARLGVKIPIVGVPMVNKEWDVSWLGDQAGWLNGTAFPTHAGNSVLAAHVYDASGQPGPFVHLGSLVWGDQIIIHAFGQEYIYEVRESNLVAPGAVAAAIQHEQLPWLTLITCQGYDENSNTYRNRVIVGAVQVAIK